MDFIAFSPDSGLIMRRGEPCGHAHAPVAPAHPSFQHIIHAQFAPYLLDALCRLLVVRDRAEWDYPKAFRTELAELEDDLIAQSIREPLLSRIATEIPEREDGDYDRSPRRELLV